MVKFGTVKPLSCALGKTRAVIDAGLPHPPHGGTGALE